MRFQHPTRPVNFFSSRSLLEVIQKHILKAHNGTVIAPRDGISIKRCKIEQVRGL